MSKIYDIVDLVGSNQFTYQLYKDIYMTAGGIGETSTALSTGININNSTTAIVYHYVSGLFYSYSAGDFRVVSQGNINSSWPLGSYSGDGSVPTIGIFKGINGFITSHGTGYVLSTDEQDFSVVAAWPNGIPYLNTYNSAPKFNNGSFPFNAFGTHSSQTFPLLLCSADGVTWIPRGDGIVSGITIDATSLLIKQAGSLSTNDQLICIHLNGTAFKTTSVGGLLSWSAITSLPQTLGSFSNATTSSTRVYVNTSNGVYYSSDIGSSWNLVTDISPSPMARLFYTSSLIAVDPGPNGKIWNSSF